ncbi:MAG: hypothetical protein J6562_06780 [Candidatus Schmidhempelia sp.]|nr:hypothetical protein [Candidatus Schmidhempelia sp.]
MMKIIISLLGCFILFNSYSWSKDSHDFTLKKDPFNTRLYQTCQKLKEDYLAEISDWRWLGIFSSFSDNQSRADPIYYQLWLINSHNEWLYLERPYQNVTTLSWQIETIEQDKLIWRIHLPDDCLMSLTHIMPFAGN